jgi:hypothetical protein
MSPSSSGLKSKPREKPTCYWQHAKHLLGLFFNPEDTFACCLLDSGFLLRLLLKPEDGIEIFLRNVG